MVVLDTDILVGFLRADEEAKAKIADYYESGQRVFTTSITAFELFKGSFSMDIQSVMDVDKLVGDLEILNFDTKSSKLLGKIYSELRRKGALIDIMDQMIASIAIANGEAVVTRNVKHFSKILGLSIEKW